MPGSFVEIYLLSQPMENVLTLPESALTEEQGSFFVYRQLDEECYEKQLVTTGASRRGLPGETGFGIERDTGPYARTLIE